MADGSGFPLGVIKSIFGLKNSSGTTIDPATEDKQDDIISALTGGTEKTRICSGDNLQLCAAVSANGLQKSIEPTRLIGKAFSGSTKDTNFWTETVTGTGSITQDGGITLSTGTTANSTTKYETIQKARLIPTNPMEFQSTLAFETEGTSNNVRRIGYYDDNDGIFFEYDGTTFKVVSRTSRSGSPVDTAISSGSFNGDADSYTPTAGAIISVKIIITCGASFFFVGSTFLHKITYTTSSKPKECDGIITIENFNKNSGTTDVDFIVYGCGVNRMGKYITQPIYKYINTNTTTICKYGAGILHRIIVNDNVGGIDIYDNTAASGTLISELDTSQGSEPAYTITYECPFDNGLTIVTSGGVEVTVIYE